MAKKERKPDPGLGEAPPKRPPTPCPEQLGAFWDVPLHKTLIAARLAMASNDPRILAMMTEIDQVLIAGNTTFAAFGGLSNDMVVVILIASLAKLVKDAVDPAVHAIAEFARDAILGAAWQQRQIAWMEANREEG